jgi:hypothetical protein
MLIRITPEKAHLKLKRATSILIHIAPEKVPSELKRATPMLIQITLEKAPSKLKRGSVNTVTHLTPAVGGVTCGSLLKLK